MGVNRANYSKIFFSFPFLATSKTFSDTRNGLKTFLLLLRFFFVLFVCLFSGQCVFLYVIDDERKRGDFNLIALSALSRFFSSLRKQRDKLLPAVSVHASYRTDEERGMKLSFRGVLLKNAGRTFK